MRCHWTHEHGPHMWTPMVQDPDNDRVLHIFTGVDSQVECPGFVIREKDDAQGQTMDMVVKGYTFVRYP